MADKPKAPEPTSGPVMGPVTRDLWEGRRGDINNGVGDPHGSR